MSDPRPAEPADAGGTESIRIERRVACAAEELWSWLSVSEKTAQWIGPWEFLDEAKGQIGLQLVAEEGAPASGATVLRCAPPSLLELRTEDAAGTWHLRVTLTADPARDSSDGDTGSTVLVFEHFDVPTEQAKDITAGWNFYLDTLLAAMGGLDKPAFEDYLNGPPA
ncbi:SRPBCC domain-containing protein [Pseudoclavibacter helvolus]|uniref:SRPBCC domain-containing protein n=1 Tax=Pseudoclavibacter helvolus TaxID=255205 RepID=UPI003C72A682